MDLRCELNAIQLARLDIAKSVFQRLPKVASENALAALRLSPS